MPIFSITTPDGKKLKVTAPEGATKEQALEKVKKQYISNPSDNFQSTLDPHNPTLRMSDGDKFLAGAGKSFIDTAQGVKQLGLEAIKSQDGPLNDFANDKLKSLEEEIAETKEQDAPLMKSGMAQAGNMTGAMTSFAPAGVVTPLANTYKGAALLGGSFGASQPRTDGDSLTKNTVLGGLGGLGGRAVVGGTSNTISPKLSNNVKTLSGEGVRMTPGQTLGGTLKRAEDGLTSIPIVGDFVKSAQRRSIEDFSKATVNKALAPIGKSTNKIGYEGVREAGDLLSKSYDEVLPLLKLKADDDFINGMFNVKSMTEGLSDDYVKVFDKEMQSILGSAFKNGQLEGKAMKEADTGLRLLAERYGKGNPRDQKIGEAFSEARNQLKQMVLRQNPQQADKLKAIDTGYANLVRIEKASGSAGADNGIFTPAHLNNAAKATDTSARKRATGRGEALLQDFAEKGKDVLPNKVPDSGTPFRMLNMLGLAGAHSIDPNMATLAATLAGAYTKPAQSIARGLITKRPKEAEELAKLISRSSPYSAIGGSNLLINSQ